MVLPLAAGTTIYVHRGLRRRFEPPPQSTPVSLETTTCTYTVNFAATVSGGSRTPLTLVVQG